MEPAKTFVAAASFLALSSHAVLALTPSEQRGRDFAVTNCSQCHSIDRVSTSPLRIAPPFRTLHTKYPIESLEEAFAEGLYTGHPTMPVFQLDPPQINDLLKYLKTLER